MVTLRSEVVVSVERALELLVRPWGSRSDAVIDLVLEPLLIVRFFKGPYDSLSGEHHYSIGSQVIDALKLRRLVEGVARIGYTDNKVLRPSQLGVETRWQNEDQGCGK